MSSTMAVERPTPYRRQTPTVWQAAARSIWAALQGAGERRAKRELMLLAHRYESFDPELARSMRAAARGQLD